MDSLGHKILKARKLKGLTQEELAELSKINLRTIQRIENNENHPRGKTLELICDVLGVEKRYLLKKENKRTKVGSIGFYMVNSVFLILLNLLIILVFGFLTLDSNANWNSKLGAILLSFFIPFFIVLFTQKMGGLERLLKFGSGCICYMISLIIIQGYAKGFLIGLRTGLFLVLIISIGNLYYGKSLLKLIK